MRRTRPGALAVALLAIGLAQPGCVSAPAPTGAAEWIWADDASAAPGRPAAYVLLRDFELDAAPEAAARLFVAADREYAVHLNGHQIARGAYRRGEPVDEFQVAHLLREGPNRLTIEARTPHGDGGVLAGIELADASMPVVTDGDWQFTDDWDPRLVKGETLLANARPALRPVRVWGRPPVGRWGRVSRGDLQKPDQIWRAAGARRIVPRDRVAGPRDRARTAVVSSGRLRPGGRRRARTRLSTVRCRRPPRTAHLSGRRLRAAAPGVDSRQAGVARFIPAQLRHGDRYGCAWVAGGPGSAVGGVRSPLRGASSSAGQKTRGYMPSAAAGQKTRAPRALLFPHRRSLLQTIVLGSVTTPPEQSHDHGDGLSLGARVF